MNLEQRVSDGGFYYIRSIDHDVAKRSLTVEFMKAPEEMSPGRRFLIFKDIEDFSVEIDDDAAVEEAADGIIDSLIGLSEYLREGEPRFELVTEDRFFNFRANREPRVVDA